MRWIAGLIVLASCNAAPEPTMDAPDPVTSTEPARRIEYAGHPDGFGDLTLPDGQPPAAGWPTVVLIHGGFWRDRFRLDLMEPLVPSLTDQRVAVWNIEYRRVGGGGGWPVTFLDVAGALDHLAVVDAPLDLDRVAAVGHSAGGHLAAWAASRPRLDPGTPGADPAVVPDLVVSQAGVLDLVDCAVSGVGQTACPDLLGADPSDEPDRYRRASPIELVPIDAAVLIVHGARDDIVPLRQSERYLDAATAAGMDTRLVVDDDAAHFEHLDPTHPVWRTVIDEVAARFSD